MDRKGLKTKNINNNYNSIFGSIQYSSTNKLNYNNKHRKTTTKLNKVEYGIAKEGN